MVVLDADSVMSGECLSEAGASDGSESNAGGLSSLRRKRPGNGYNRCQQFATRVYGPAVYRRAACLAVGGATGAQCHYPREAV